MSAIGYVVLEYNQASGQPRLAVDDVFHTSAEAQELAEYETTETTRIGRRERYVVAELTEVYE